MKKTHGGVWAMLTVAALVVSACGGPAASTRPSTAATTAPSTATTAPVATGTPAPVASATTGPVGSATAGTCPDAAANQTIEMWSPLTGPDGDEMSDLAARFSSENEWGITVNHVPQPDYMRSLTTPGGVLPALTVARVINVGELASRHVLRPFSADLMAIFGEDRAADFPENLWARGEFNGERYSIPLDGSPLVMYYNKDMFAAANVEEPGTEPWTKAEFEAALAALETSGVQPISLGTGFQAGVLFHTFIYQFGGALTNEDGTEVTFASPEGVEALTYLKKLRDESGSTASGGGDPEVQPFTAGTAAIVIHGPWHISNMVQLPFAGFAPLPQVGDNYAVWGGSHQFALTTDDAAKQAAAMCWISWMSDNSVQWGAAGQVPARTSVREDPELATVAAPIAAVAGSSSAVQLLPQVPALEDAVWGRGYGPAVDAILLGDQTDIQAALTAAQATSQQIVDDNAAQFATP